MRTSSAGKLVRPPLSASARLIATSPEHQDSHAVPGYKLGSKRVADFLGRMGLERCCIFDQYASDSLAASVRLPMAKRLTEAASLGASTLRCAPVGSPSELRATGHIPAELRFQLWQSQSECDVLQ